MRKINNIMLVGIVSLLSITSCTLEKVGDLNGPALETILEKSTRGDIQDLVGGMLSDMRIRLGNYQDNVGVVGREYYRFSSSEPRYTSELLGKNKAVLDNNTFYTTGPWSARYGTVNSGNIILQAIPNTDPAYNAEELNGINGIIKTIQAHELLLNLNLMTTIRVDVKNPKKLGPFLENKEALEALLALLDDAAKDLEDSGSAFPVKLSTGFESFNSPKTFREFNRALAARVAIYAGLNDKANEALAESFMNLVPSPGFLYEGGYYVFSPGGGDILNPLFFPKNASDAGARIAHPLFITDAAKDVGDNIIDKRVIDKTNFRQKEDTNGDLVPDPLSSDGLSGGYDVFVYKSNVDAAPIIRNEELILIYAEANLGTAIADNAINLIRAEAGLAAKSGVTIEDVLNERRYSLFAEGHRWIDMRRYNKLGELPIDREAKPDGDPPVEADDVWEKFPVPATENQ